RTEADEVVLNERRLRREELARPHQVLLRARDQLQEVGGVEVGRALRQLLEDERDEDDQVLFLQAVLRLHLHQREARGVRRRGEARRDQRGEARDLAVEQRDRLGQPFVVEVVGVLEVEELRRALLVEAREAAQVHHVVEGVAGGPLRPGDDARRRRAALWPPRWAPAP